MIRIKYIADLINGFAFKPISFDYSNPFPVIRITDVDEKIDIQKCYGVQFDPRLSPYTVKRNDVLVALSGATVGKSGLFDDDKPACINQRVGIIRPRCVRPEYLKYCLLDDMFLDFVRLTSMGSAQPNISTNDIKNFYIPTRSDEEQIKIVNELNNSISKINDSLSFEEQEIEKLRAYRYSLISELCKNGLRKSKKKKTKNHFIGELPIDWELAKIKHHCYLKGRIGWQGLKAEEYKDEGPFLITGTDFLDGTINWDTCTHITEARYKEAYQIQIKENDLLITKDGTVGKVAIVQALPYKTSLNSGIMLIRNESGKYINKYLFYCLSSNIFWDWFDYNQRGQSTIIHLYQEQFGNFQFPLPPIAEQKEIVNYLDKKVAVIDSLIKLKTEKIEKLKQFKKSIIYERIHGKGMDTNA